MADLATIREQPLSNLPKGRDGPHGNTCVQETQKLGSPFLSMHMQKVVNGYKFTRHGDRANRTEKNMAWGEQPIQASGPALSATPPLPSGPFVLCNVINAPSAIAVLAKENRKWRPSRWG